MKRIVICLLSFFCSMVVLATNVRIVVPDGGGRVDISYKLNKIVFDMKGPGGRHEVFIADLDFKNKECITKENPQIPSGGRGQPALHPSGKYLAFQVKNEHSQDKATEQFSLGINNDLYVATLDKKKAWRLTDNPKGYAVLHPKFSHDGRKIMWSEKYEDGPGSRFGHWRIKLADFIITEEGVSLKSIENLQPAGECWYETHTFSADDKMIYFSGNLEGGRGNDIYRYNLKDKKLKRITTSNNVWDEMAEISPKGDRIAFISNRFASATGILGFLTLRTEIYTMDIDGKNVKRITYLNRPLHGYLVGDLAWSPDANKIYALSFDRVRKKYSIIEVNLEGT